MKTKIKNKIEPKKVNTIQEDIKEYVESKKDEYDGIVSINVINSFRNKIAANIIILGTKLGELIGKEFIVKVYVKDMETMSQSLMREALLKSLLNKMK